MIRKTSDIESSADAHLLPSDFRTRFGASRRLQRRAHEVIPGGCHTYAKGDDQFPWLTPGFIARGHGCHVWDADDNEYIEYGSGLRAVTLGHAYGPVVDAVRRELSLGCNFSRPAPLEVTCAETLLSMIPGAEMAKFAKDGSTATNGAIRLARAATGRDKIAICADHPFYSTADWFIGTTDIDAGIPAATKELTVSFRYNDIDSLVACLREHRDQIAAVIMEPAKYTEPVDDFLHKAKEECHRHGALFILDEMITGFRWHNGGGQAYFEIEPDLSTFGKAMANGFSVSALVGKRKYMELGGLRHDGERVFLLSTTHGAETHALAAAQATMEVYQQQPVIETLNRRGHQLREGVEELITTHRLDGHFEVVGPDCCLVFGTRDENGQPSQAFRCLFLQETIKRGVLAPSFIVNYSHTKADIDRTLYAIDEALFVYRKAIAHGVGEFLVGRPSEVVYRKYNGPGPWYPGQPTQAHNPQNEE